MGWVQGSSILLLVAIATGTNAGCPSGCTCTAGRKPLARCTSSSLKGPFPNETKIIDAHGSRIRSMEEDAFSGLYTIDEILLNDNQLSDISKVTFAGGENIRTLNLANNRITSLSKDTFFVLKRLSKLDLSNNHIRNLPDGIFNRSLLLRDLNLRNCGLTRLALGVFPALINKLDLSLNRGLQLPVGPNGETLFDGSKVREINLDDSDVTTDVHYFQNATRVRKISLKGDTVTGIAPDNRLEKMCLNGNCYKSCGGGEFNDLNKPMSKLKESSAPDLHGMLLDLDPVRELYIGTKTRIAVYADVAFSNSDLAVDTSYPVQVVARSFYIDMGKRVKAGRSVQACKFKYVVSRAGQRKLIFAKFGPLSVLTDSMYYDGHCAYDTSIRHSGVVPNANVLKAIIRCAQMNRADIANLQTIVLPMLNSVVSLASASGTSSSVQLRSILDEAKKKQVDVDIEIRSESRIVPSASLHAYTEILGNLHKYGNNYETQYQNMKASLERTEIAKQTFDALTTQASNLHTVALDDQESGEVALDVSSATLEELKTRFVTAKADMKRDKETFEEGVEKYKAEQKAKAALAFVKAIFSIVMGAVTEDPAAIFDGIMDLVEAMMGLIELIQQITALMSSLDKMTKTLGKAGVPDTNVTTYLNDIEKAAGLEVKMAEWQNLMILANTQLDTDTVRKINGATNFRESVHKLANYGAFMTSQLITHSRLVNEAYTNQLALELSQVYLDQVAEDFDRLERKDIEKSALLWQLKMQRFQAQMFLSHHILQYCRTFYYFMLVDCKASIKPLIGDSMFELLGKISMAKINQLLDLVKMGTSSDMREVVTLEDKKPPVSPCYDDHDCPITRLKEKSTIVLNITRANDDDFKMYERVRVDEIEVLLVGAKTSDNAIRLYVSNTGQFKDYYSGEEFDFLSIPFNRVFKYTPNSDGSAIKSISIKANDVNQAYFMSTTPFSIWYVEFNPAENEGIDLSGLTQIKITFIGNVVSAKRPAPAPAPSTTFNFKPNGAQFGRSRSAFGGGYGRRRRRKRSILKYEVKSIKA